MFPVFQAPSLAEAELYRQRLEDEGIACTLRNTHLQGALGELPANLLPEVCVLAEEDYETARALISGMEEQRKRPSGPDQVCSVCAEASPSNFEVCWKCRAELPAR